MKCIYCVLSIVLIINALAYDLKPALSFSSPFSQFDYSGRRKINNWNCAGDAVINEFFVRLTPDRQSKNGHCWSQYPIDSNEWVTNIKFRISGQGASLFGDGFSVFFTQSPSHINGKMFGTNDIFYGFAVVFSTFKNTEFARYHRDVALYVGDGETGAFVQDKDHAGCFSKYRFHEKRQDFSVDNYVVVKIGYSAVTGMVRVAIDESHTGNFHICLNEKVDMKPNWFKEAYIGLGSATGQLADNHDILSIETVTGEGDPDQVNTSKQASLLSENERVENSEKRQQASGLNTATLTEVQKGLIGIIDRVEKEQNDQLSKLKRELEHSLVAVDDSLNTMIKKLQERGDLSEGRIEELEQSLKSKMQSSLSSELETRLKSLEKVFDMTMQQEVSKNSKNWIIPFFILLVVIGGAMYVVYNRYRYLKKAHLF